ncbi:MAG: hypothetical protein COA84_13335 [Robiginitomaculum sp.]|nr:MAG: hypothetical protein COA84_13335 [Robiginitomaculum sp.]
MGKKKYRKSKWVRDEFGVEMGWVCFPHHAIHYKMSGWEYKKHRLVFCENVDGRIANTVCVSNITHPKLQLDVDHINGDSSNNQIENLQTLCKNCHAVKTNINKDWESPGRTYYANLKKAQNEKSN